MRSAPLYTFCPLEGIVCSECCTAMHAADLTKAIIVHENRRHGGARFHHDNTHDILVAFHEYINGIVDEIMAVWPNQKEAKQILLQFVRPIHNNMYFYCTAGKKLCNGYGFYEPNYHNHNNKHISTIVPNLGKKGYHSKIFPHNFRGQFKVLLEDYNFDNVVGGNEISFHRVFCKLLQEVISAVDVVVNDGSSNNNNNVVHDDGYESDSKPAAVVVRAVVPQQKSISARKKAPPTMLPPPPTKKMKQPTLPSIPDAISAPAVRSRKQLIPEGYQSCIALSTQERCKNDCDQCDEYFKTEYNLKKLRVEYMDGYGVFATADIPPNKFIRKYTGKISSENPRSSYAVKLKGKKTYVDAINSTGIHRYMNHSCVPNCRLVSWIDKYNNDMVVIVSGEDEIKSGKELTIHYGDESKKIFPEEECKCSECMGKGGVEAYEI